MNTQDSKAHLTPLSVKLKELEEKGYQQEFVFAGGVLKDTSGNTYQASELKIIEEHRFEGESNPDDMSILYAVKGQNGVKGTVVTPYGTYVDELAEFMKDVEEQRK